MTNNEPVDVQCSYDAKKTKGLIGPGDTNRNFSLKVGVTLSFMEIPLGTTYHVVISCQGKNVGTAFVQDFTG